MKACSVLCNMRPEVNDLLICASSTKWNLRRVTDVSLSCKNSSFSRKVNLLFAEKLFIQSLLKQCNQCIVSYRTNIRMTKSSFGLLILCILEEKQGLPRKLLQFEQENNIVFHFRVDISVKKKCGARSFQMQLNQHSSGYGLSFTHIFIPSL